MKSHVSQSSETASISEIEATLWSVIDRPRCVLRFDANLVDDLPLILNENYGIKQATDASRCKPLQRLMSQLGVSGNASFQELPQRIATAGIDKSKFRPVANSTVLEENAQLFDHWSLTTATGDVDAVVALQRDLGMGQYNVAAKRHDMRMVRRRPERVLARCDERSRDLVSARGRTLLLGVLDYLVEAPWLFEA